DALPISAPATPPRYALPAACANTTSWTCATSSGQAFLARARVPALTAGPERPEMWLGPCVAGLASPWCAATRARAPSAVRLPLVPSGSGLPAALRAAPGFFAAPARGALAAGGAFSTFIVFIGFLAFCGLRRAVAPVAASFLG